MISASDLPIVVGVSQAGANYSRKETLDKSIGQTEKERLIRQVRSRYDMTNKYDNDSKYI